MRDSKRDDYLHLLSLVLATGEVSSDTAGAVVKSSKLMIIRLISSTSLRMGAMTSEHRNFDPESKKFMLLPLSSILGTYI